MNKSTYILVASMLFTSFLFSSCMKDVDDDFYFRDAVVEFENATTLTKAPGKNYPLLPILARNSGVTEYRINLLGEQLPQNQNLVFRVIPEESTAVEGEHYSLPNGNTILLPANESFGYLEVEVLDFPEGGSGTVLVVFELVGNETVRPSENYKQIGVRINLQ